MIEDPHGNKQRDNLADVIEDAGCTLRKTQMDVECTTCLVCGQMFIQVALVPSMSPMISRPIRSVSKELARCVSRQADS